jgi:hypothetical protein
LKKTGHDAETEANLCRETKTKRRSKLGARTEDLNWKQLRGDLTRGSGKNRI